MMEKDIKSILQKLSEIRNELVYKEDINNAEMAEIAKMLNEIEEVLYS